MLPFFQKYKLKLRVFDIFYKCIFRHDPLVENQNNKTMYVLADGDHIYTLSHDLKRLEQMQECEDPEYLVKASTDYRIREDKQQVNTR